MNVIQGCIEDLISLLLEVCFGDAVEPCALGGLAFADGFIGTSSSLIVPMMYLVIWRSSASKLRT